MHQDDLASQQEAIEKIKTIIASLKTTSKAHRVSSLPARKIAVSPAPVIDSLNITNNYRFQRVLPLATRRIVDLPACFIVTSPQPMVIPIAHSTRSRASHQLTVITQDEQYANAVINTITRESLTYRQLI